MESSGVAGGVNATRTGLPAAESRRSECDKEVGEGSAGQSAADSPGVQSPAAKCRRCAPEGRALPGADLSGLVPTFPFGSADGSTVTVRAREMPGADSSGVASRVEVSGAQGRGGAGPVARRRARGAAGSTAGRGRVGGERLVGAARAAEMGTWAQEQPSGGDAGETRRRSQRLAAARACEEVRGAGGNATPQSRGRGGDDRRGRGRRSAPGDHGEIPMRRAGAGGVEAASASGGSGQGRGAGGSDRAAGGDTRAVRLVESRSRIVMGFGRGRVDDVVRQQEQREQEGLVRARRRVEEGTRGDMIGFSGQTLDRGTGGAWRAGPL